MQKPYLLVFVSSLSVLSFEILLIRIFTIRLSYHYASLIISLSMAGLVMGSLLVFFRQRMSQLLSFSASQLLPYLAAALPYLLVKPKDTVIIAARRRRVAAAPEFNL